MSRARLIIAVLAVVALLAGGVLAFTLTRSEDVQGSPGAAAGAFLSAWEEERWNELGRYVFEPPPRLPERHQGLLEDLHVASLELDAGAAQEDGDRGLVPFEATVEVSGLGEFSYRGRVETVRENGRWWVEWSPRVVHPHLDDGDRLRRMRTWPERAPIEGHDGVELMAPREAVIVGITPQRIQDRPSLLAAL
ncbi:MAG TPA: NTF2-like N-terminal transpeptidase domain-containing protein, partial [Acidimicrobiia bacterium]|nr:NTF2-like N-terminal transpeptidase domain-containing protein [Acidimicrobiia bacterium]